MSEEQDKPGGESQENPIEESVEDHKGGSKVIIIVIVLIIAVAGIVLSRQDGGGDIDTNTEPEAGDVIEKEEDTSVDGDTIEQGTVIDDGAGFEVDAEEAQLHEFTVTGKNFEFSMGEIKVKKGDTVTINFSSTDGFHDWVVDEFDAATERVNPGSDTSVIFVADKTGTFEYYCSVGTHRQLGMVGNLIVE
jgi:plastocyanin